MSSSETGGKAWNWILQAVVGAEQAVHSGATHSGEMQPLVQAVVLHSSC